MLGIILTAHGKAASGILSGLEMITGGGDNVKALDFTIENQSSYANEIKNLIDEQLKKYEKVIVACDMAGGTPFNQSVLNGNGKNVKILAGLNFQMAYELVFSETDIDSTVENALNSAKEGIIVFEEPDNNENEDFSEGI
ncbi:MAG: PTS fructose transporter subunit IIBC [Peptoniphilaceae bacterium]|nr:PTS fructose transporter subunit IIBC [Peptoniphilaceae bacterium]MDY3738639.1 PTS fructose transporter subunit IIBC [Peptoniphilaceae bacterium]